VLQRLLTPGPGEGKPPYPLAPGEPLVLHRCGFQRLSLGMQPAVLRQLDRHFLARAQALRLAAARAENALQFLRLECQVRSADVGAMLRDLTPGPQKRKRPVEESLLPAPWPFPEEWVAWGRVVALPDFLKPHGPYVPLLERRREPGLEERLGPGEDMGPGEGGRDTAAFFAKMRQQGSLLS